MKTIILTLFFVIAICYSSNAQNLKEGELKNQLQIYTYAYIQVENAHGGFSAKLDVHVDLGDTPEQINTGKEYSEALKGRKSYASILNFMSEKQFELVESRETAPSFQATGGNLAVIFIMRKKSQ